MKGTGVALLIVLFTQYSSAQDRADSATLAPRQTSTTRAKLKSADQLWAEALWKSLPGNQVPRQDIEQLLLDSLSRAEKRAPLYVALGDVDSGLVALRDSVQVMQMSIDNALNDLKPLKSKAQMTPGDEAESGDELSRNFRESYNEVILQELTRAGIDELTSQFHAGTCNSVVWYSQAVKVDPGYKLGWQKLAVSSEGAVAEKAIEGWIQNDPNNALPFYLRAAREADSGKLATALQSIRAGNGKSECQSYSSALPTEFELTYPADEPFQKLGIADKRISPSALAFLVRQGEDLQPFGDPMCLQLEDVARALKEEAKRLQMSRRFVEAIEHYEAVRLMGVQLMCIESHTKKIMYEGYHMTLATDTLRELYSAENNSGEIARLDRFQSARKLFRLRYFDTILKDLKPDESNLNLWLRGQVDPVKLEQRLLGKAVQDSGLLIEIERHRRIERQKNDR